MKTTALLSAEDFAVVAPLLGPCELVKGEIVPMSPAGARHSEVVARATFLLQRHNRAHELGRVFAGEAGIIVARRPDTVRGAGVAFVSYQRLPRHIKPTDAFVEAAPELVIEVFGRDVTWEKMDAKVAEYHTHGVDLVWVLDPHTLTLRAYPRGDAPYVLRDSDIASADPVMPGFSVRVAEFFED
jgi:Uma2 family endonuclease